MFSEKRIRPELVASRTVIVTSLTGRLAGIAEQLAGGPTEAEHGETSL